MAKMFYTLEEAKAALGKNEEEIKQFAREGRLREFRDGPRLMFKADQVEQLKSRARRPAATPVDLGVSDSGGIDRPRRHHRRQRHQHHAGRSRHRQAAPAARHRQPQGRHRRHRHRPAGSLGGVPSPTSRGSLLGGSLGGAASSGRRRHRHRHPARRQHRRRHRIARLATGAGGTAPAGVPAAAGLSGSMAGRSRGGINVFGSDDVGLRRPLRPDRHLRRPHRGLRGQPRDRRLRLRPARPHPRERRHQPGRRARRDRPRRRHPHRARAIGGTEVGGRAGRTSHESAVDRRPLAAPVMVQQLDRPPRRSCGAAIAGFAAVLFAAFVLISTLIGAIRATSSSSSPTWAC